MIRNTHLRIQTHSQLGAPSLNTQATSHPMREREQEQEQEQKTTTRLPANQLPSSMH